MKIISYRFLLSFFNPLSTPNPTRQVAQLNIPDVWNSVTAQTLQCRWMICLARC